MKGYIRPFDELWIPDVEGHPNLSGKLSRPKKYPLRSYFFVGPLTRFSRVTPGNVPETFDLLVILSGPEPQRTLLEEKLVNQIRETELRTVVLQGKPESQEVYEEGNIRFLTHADDETIAGLFLAARYVISRPGYTTLMDLSVFGNKALLIPTPGQTEQEYLAQKVEREGLFYTAKQQQFQLQKALQEAENYKGLQWENYDQLLDQRLTSIFP
ncbi:MAG: glycosyltransferase [bacterium]